MRLFKIELKGMSQPFYVVADNWIDAVHFVQDYCIKKEIGYHDLHSLELLADTQPSTVDQLFISCNRFAEGRLEYGCAGQQGFQLGSIQFEDLLEQFKGKSIRIIIQEVQQDG